MARDTWVQDYRDAEQFAQEVMELINERNSQSRSGGSSSAKIQSSIRSKLQTFSQDIQQLKTSLARTQNTITPQEADRRQQQIFSLISREKQLQQAFKPQSGYGNDSARAGLLNEGFDTDRPDRHGAGNGAGRNNFGDNGDAENMTTDQYRNRQEQIMKEQDKGLDALSSVIKRQKMMGQAIGGEIDYQNDLIDEITDHVDSTDQKLIRTEAKVHKATKKASTCCLMVIVILLLIAIIVAGVVPK